MRQLRNIAVAVLMAAFTFTALGAGTAQADGNEPVVVEARMTIMCDQLDAAALAYAVDHQYCTADGKPVFSATGEAVGDCGKSWIYIYNQGRPGEAKFQWGFQSTLGAAMFRSLRVSWYNWTRGRAGGWPDEDWMNSSFYDARRYEGTSAGFVTTGLSGSIILVWGGICGIANPTANGYIS